MSKKAAIFVGLVVFVLIFSTPAYARHGRVLGAATESATPQIPPTTEGPGLILPDSPFFFLDEFKQAVRLFFAFTPEEKAKVHAAIAGERLAELRFMLAKQNQAGIETDLKGISDNLKAAANDLAAAQLSGKNVSTVAKDINDNIKRKQQTLDILESQSSGELKAQVTAAQASLLNSKVKVEDALPENEIDKEIRDDLDRQIEKKVDEASDSARELMDGLDELSREASDAAQKSLRKREDALKKAIEERNDTLKKIQETLFEAEKKKQEKLLDAQNQASEQAKAAIEKAQEAARGFQKAQDALEKIQQQGVGGNSGTSSGGSSQGSGSSGGGGSGGTSGSSGESSGSSSGGGGDHGGSGGKD